MAEEFRENTSEQLNKFQSTNKQLNKIRKIIKDMKKEINKDTEILKN
jgi:uncharacterized protein involved in exopolysaccharide biosynthesis